MSLPKIFSCVEKIKNILESERIYKSTPVSQLIMQEWEKRLAPLDHLLTNKIIDPTVQLCTSIDTLAPYLSNRVLRIGFYPLSANPLHWGHLLVALSAIVHNQLDKIIFIIAGNDPKKPHLALAQWRHGVAEDILEKFSPLFEYSNIAQDGNSDGETNIFKLLALNPFQKIDAFYIVGTDHYYRQNPEKGGKDTIQKLEDNIANKIHNYNEILHSLSVIFVERAGGSPVAVNTSLNVSIVPPLNFLVSSTLIREALTKTKDKQILALLPLTILRHSLDHGIYSL